MLCDMLGFDNTDFVQLLISKRLDLIQLAVNAQKAAIQKDLPSLNQSFVITTEEEKKLQRAKNRDRKKGKKHDVSTTSFPEFEYTITDRHVLLKDPLLQRHKQNEEQLKTATGIRVTSYGNSSISTKSGDNINLPANTKVKSTNTYQEYIVPYTPLPIIKKSNLIPISKLDKWAQEAFKGFTHFNRMQSVIYDAAYNNNNNLLVCAPTGAGKTNVAALTMLQEIKKNFIGEYLDKNSFKIVYIAPMKALAAEMVESFSKRLNYLGINVREFTGDMTLTKKELNETQVIVTTPEKWDITTRKSTDIALVELVKLLIFDEVHLLHEERGPVIETLVARTLRQMETSQQQIRIIGLSATLPNFIDVATFLRVDPPTGLFYFDASYRPVPLNQSFIGISNKNPAQQKNIMNRIAYDKTLDAIYSGHQVMIFVHSRKDTVKTAQTIREIATENGTIAEFLGLGADNFTSLMHEALKARGKELKQLIDYGFGVHHAGMLRSDRSLVEKLFTKGVLKVLVCTATLAWGVNLPAHTVIIKGTEIYDAKHGAFMDIGMLDVMQIFGRAGRPQFDTSGDGIIITTEEKAQKYLRLLSHSLPIESQFISRLADNLNAEIALGTVTSIDDAIQWLSYTYWFVRMIKNPVQYGISQVIRDRDPTLHQYRSDCLKKAAELLHKCKMIRYIPDSGTLSITQLGRVASNFYIEHETMEIFGKELSNTMSRKKILSMISQAHEFSQIAVREDEFPELENLRDNCCMVLPIDGNVENSHGKVNILLQSYISKSDYKNFALVSDSAYVVKNASRIFRGLVEISMFRGYPELTYELILWCKMIDKRLWWNQHPLQQFGLKSSAMLKLESKNATLDRLIDMSSSEIGNLVNHPKIGDIIKEYVLRVPYLSMNATIQPITSTVIKIKLELYGDFKWDNRTHGSIEPFWIWVEDSEMIYDKHYFLLQKDKKNEIHFIEFDIPVPDPRPSFYIVRSVSDHWLGAESEISVTLDNLVLPGESFKPTPLLELTPLPKSSLQNEKYENLFNFQHFNPIQTQLFHTIMYSDNNILLGAPTGSGKTTIGELGILRVFNEYKNGKIVYIGPLKALVRERIKDWKKKFGNSIMNKKVVELTGDVTPDLESLKKSDIILTTPEKWDGVSRNWKQRKYVQKVSLIIIDEIHMLGQDRGPILEVIVSRMRYIASQLNTVCRIIGLSTSLANPLDLADWLGIEKNGLYNFKPSIRPIPLEAHISGFPGRHYCPRMATMNRPTYLAILEHSPYKPVLIFVSSRRQTRLTALELINLAVASDNPPQFNQMSSEESEEISKLVSDDTLRQTLKFGIGMHHAGLSPADRTLTEELFRHQKIQILVTTSTLAWGVNLPAHLVVIKGTEYFEAKEKRYVDFPITDVMQMMGRAGRPQFDDRGVAVILVHEPRKNFYRKFLYEPFPVESSLLNCLHDHLNAEIVSGMISCKQDCMDYLTWTFLYRRILQNPSYYGINSLKGKSLEYFLSDKIEYTLQDLSSAGCIKINEDDTIESLTPGIIASYYYLSFESVNLFNLELKENSDIESLLNTLCAAAEYDELPVRHNEEFHNEELAKEVRYEVDEFSYEDPHTKACLLLQSHFSHLSLPIVDYKTDTKSVLDQAIRILQAMIDVAADEGYLSTVKNIIILLQMIVQACWFDTSPISLLPGLDNNISKILEEKGYNSINDIISKLSNVKSILKPILSSLKYDKFEKDIEIIPKISMKLGKISKNVKPGEMVSIKVLLNRESKQSKFVHAPKFPKKVIENWFLLLADEEYNEVLSVKRIPLKMNSSSILEFISPPDSGEYEFTVCFISGSYLSLETKQKFIINVVEE